MARGSNRDVTLTLSLETLGEEGVKALGQSIQQLAAQGGKAGPEFAQLADEIDRIATQQQALEAFKALGNETEQLETRQRSVAQAVDSTTTRLQELGTVTQQAATKQRDVATALSDAQKSYNDITAELRNYKAGTADALKGTDDYVTGLKALVTRQAEAKNAIIDARTEQRAANKDLSEAESAQNKIAASLAKQEKALQSANNALTENRTELGRATKASEELGVATADVAAAEAQLLEAFNSVGRAAAARKASIDDMIEADKLLAIETATLAELQQRGADALQAEVLAQRDAARAVREYETAVAQAADNAAQWQREAEAVVNAAEAAQRLQRETVSLVAAQQELQQQRAFEKQAEDAKKLIQAADYVRFWTEALDKADTQVAQTAAAAEEASQRIDTAFKTLGIRSVQDLQREIAEVRVAMATAADQAQRTGTSIDGAFSTGQAKIRELERQIREVSGTLTAADKAAALFKNSIGQIAAGNIVADAIGSLVEKVKELGREFILTIVQTDQLRRGLNAVYGSITTTAQQITFLRTTALDAGVSVGSLQSNFVKFAASMQSANIPLAVSNDLFSSVTRAAGTLGIAGEEVSGMLQALSQIASKGTVSMEELRQQLGDRLPGAIGLAAKGLGITEQQLIKLVESGNLAARDFFPALSGALKTLNGEVSGLRPGFENLKTALTTTAQAAGDSGWTQLLVLGLQTLGLAIAAVVVPLQYFFELVFGGAKVLGTLTGAVVTLTNPLEELSKIFTDAGKRLDTVNGTFQALVDGTDKATASTNTNAKATAQSTEAIAAQQLALKGNADAAAALGTQAITTTEGIEALAAATTLSAQLASGQAESYVKLSVAIAETLKGLDKRQEAADKEAKAIAITGASLVKMTELRGNESEALRAQVEAADNNTAALQKASGLRQAEVEVLLVQKQALEQLAIAQDGNLEKRKVELDAINLKLVKAGAEAEQSGAAVEQAKAEAFSRGLVAKAYEDNSKRVEQFATATATAREALTSTSRAFAEGRANTDDLTAANKRLTEATYLLRDAIKDRSDASKRNLDSLKAEAEITKAQIELDLTLLRVKQQDLVQRGLTIAAVKLGNEIADLELRATVKSTEAKRAEANEIIRSTAVRLDQERALGTLTPALEQELQTRIKQQQAIVLQTDASVINERQQAKENEAVRNGTAVRGEHTRAVGSSTIAVGGNTGIVNDNTGALTRNAEATNTASAAQQRYNESLRAGGGIGPSQDGVNFGVRSPGGAANQVNTPESFSNTPFRSGSSAGANPAASRTVETGQAVNRPTSGTWTYTVNPYEVEVKGVDARGNPVPGGWMRVRSESAGLLGNDPQTGQPLPGRSIPVPSPAPAPIAPSPSPAPTPSNFTMNVTIGGQQFGIGATSKSDLDKMLDALQAAHAAGGG